MITDFNKSEDVIRLTSFYRPRYDAATRATTPIEYSLGASPEGLPEGTALTASHSYIDYGRGVTPQPDLIAILQGIAPDTLSLEASYFEFLTR